MADQFTRRIMQAVLGLTVVYTIYPVVGAAVTVGTVVTSGAAAYGAVKELIALNAIATDYWVCAVDTDTPGALQPFRVEIGTGLAGVYVTARMQFQLDWTTVVTTAVGTAGYKTGGRILIGPFPAYVAPNTQLVARATGTAAKVIGLSTIIATGL